MAPERSVSAVASPGPPKFTNSTPRRWLGSVAGYRTTGSSSLRPAGRR